MRGTGTTTQQILAAPRGALFVWCNRFDQYPRELVKRLGRTDLKVVSVAVLEDPYTVHGTLFTAVIVDHATEGTVQRHLGFTRLLQMCRIPDNTEFLELHNHIAFAIKPETNK